MNNDKNYIKQNIIQDSQNLNILNNKNYKSDVNEYHLDKCLKFNLKILFENHIKDLNELISLFDLNDIVFLEEP